MSELEDIAAEVRKLGDEGNRAQRLAEAAAQRLDALAREALSMRHLGGLDQALDQLAGARRSAITAARHLHELRIGANRFADQLVGGTGAATADTGAPAYAALGTAALAGAGAASRDGLAPETLREAMARNSDGARSFADDDEAAAYGRKEWAAADLLLTNEQRRAVFDYSREPNGMPDDVTYRQINDALRREAPCPPNVAAHIQALDSALGLRPTPEAITATRVTGISHWATAPEDLVEGDVFSEPAYLSTSLGSPGLSGGDAVMHLRIPARTPALWVEDYGAYGAAERELLLGRGLRWRVTQTPTYRDGQWHVFAEVLQP